MKLTRLVLVAALVSVGCLVTAPRAQESVTLTTPVQAVPGASLFRVSQLNLNWRSANIVIVLDEFTGGVWVPGPNARQIIATYDGAEATALMTTLNKVNLSTRSLNQRIFDKLLADGKIPAGAVTGSVP